MISFNIFYFCLCYGALFENTLHFVSCFHYWSFYKFLLNSLLYITRYCKNKVTSIPFVVLLKQTIEVKALLIADET
jgi:hypothetical protein